jgi:hypothetical protein
MANQRCGVGVWSWGNGRAAAGRFVELSSSQRVGAWWERACTLRHCTEKEGKGYHSKGARGCLPASSSVPVHPRAAASFAAIQFPLKPFSASFPCLHFSEITSGLKQPLPPVRSSLSREHLKPTECPDIRIPSQNHPPPDPIPNSSSSCMSAHNGPHHLAFPDSTRVSQDQAACGVPIWGLLSRGLWVCAKEETGPGPPRSAPNLPELVALHASLASSVPLQPHLAAIRHPAGAALGSDT